MNNQMSWKENRKIANKLSEILLSKKWVPLNIRQQSITKQRLLRLVR
jgi:hypothetical protein